MLLAGGGSKIFLEKTLSRSISTIKYEASGEMNSELTKDGIHLCLEAYERWADAIKTYIE